MTSITKEIKLNDKIYKFSKQTIYRPEIGDTVIGRIIFVGNEFYKINLFNFSVNTGILPVLSFKNATKRNRPNLNTNDIVVAKVISLETEILLTCDDDFLGLLPISSQNDDSEDLNKGKVLMQMYPHKCKMLYFTNILQNISKTYEYEIYIGLNGVIWLNCEESDVKNIGRLLFKFNIEN